MMPQSVWMSEIERLRVCEIMRHFGGEASIRADEALRNSILADAETNAREFFEILLRGCGFTDITITFEAK